MNVIPLADYRESRRERLEAVIRHLIAENERLQDECDRLLEVIADMPEVDKP